MGGRGNSSIEVLRCRNSHSNTMFIYPLCAVYVGEVLFVVYFFLACLWPSKTSVSPRSSPLGTFRAEETSPAAKSEEKRMFSQASVVCILLSLEGKSWCLYFVSLALD